MKFKVDSSDSIGSYDKINYVQIETLNEILDFVKKRGGDVYIHTYDDEPTVIETHEAIYE